MRGAQEGCAPLFLKPGQRGTSTANLPGRLARTLDEVADFVRMELQGAYADTNAVLCTISVVEMSDEEVAALPEWEP